MQTMMRATAGYFWALFSLGLVVAAMGPSLPVLAQGTGSTLGAVGLLFTAFRIGYMTGALFGGAATDRLQGNHLVAMAMVLLAGAAAAASAMHILAAVLGLFVVVGLAAGTIEVGANALVLWAHGEGAAPWMNGLHFAFGVGAMISPVLIGYTLVTHQSLTPAFIGITILVLPGVLLLWRAPLPAAPAAQQDSHGVSHGVTVILVALFLFLYIGVESSMGGWIFSWASAVYHMTPVRAAAATSVFWATLTAGRLLAIPVATRMLPRTMLIQAVAGAAVSVALLELSRFLLSEQLFWVAITAAGLSLSVVVPTTMAFAGRAMRVTGSVSRWFFIGGGAGGMTIPPLMGHLLDGQGPQLIMPVLLAAILVMGVILALLLYQTRSNTGMHGA